MDAIWEASIMEVMLDRISPSSFGATSWSFPTTKVWIKFVNSSYRKEGGHAKGDVRTSVSGIVAGEMHP